MNKRSIFILLAFICLQCGLFANPFLGSTEENKASPVRTEQTSQQLTDVQRQLQNILGDAFYKVKDGGVSVLFIFGIAFLYGVIHALGPGHRKTVVFSLYLSRNAPAWEPAVAGLILAFLHGGLSIILLLILQAGTKGAISARADNAALMLEGSCYTLLAIIAAVMVVGSIRTLCKRFSRKHNTESDVPVENNKITTKNMITLFSTGLYPCPGALLVLVLATSLSMTGEGICAVSAMSVGMSIPIIACGYAAWFGRTGLFNAVKSHEKTLRIISSIVELLGFLFLLCFALYTAWPFLVGVIKQFL